jgi:hypothetical protein
VLETYFVYLRTRVIAGAIGIEQEQAAIDSARKWIEARAKDSPGLARYLAAWGDWTSPWAP